MRKNKIQPHHPIRRFEHRFSIILYHLGKVIEEWGMCRGLSGDDKEELIDAFDIIRFKSLKGPFVPYAGQIPDEHGEPCPCFLKDAEESAVVVKL